MIQTHQPPMHPGLLIVEIELAPIGLDEKKAVWRVCPGQSRLCAIAMDAPMGIPPDFIPMPSARIVKNYAAFGGSVRAGSIPWSHYCGAILKTSCDGMPSSRHAAIAHEAAKASGSPSLCVHALLSGAINEARLAAFDDEDALGFCLDAYALLADSPIFDGAKVLCASGKPLAAMLEPEDPFGESFLARLEKLALASQTRHAPERAKLRI